MGDPPLVCGHCLLRGLGGGAKFGRKPRAPPELVFASSSVRLWPRLGWGPFGEPPQVVQVANENELVFVTSKVILGD